MDDLQAPSFSCGVLTVLGLILPCKKPPRANSCSVAVFSQSAHQLRCDLIHDAIFYLGRRFIRVCFNPRDFDEPRWQSISTANLTLGLTRQFRAFSAHQFPLFPPFWFRCAYILLSLVYIKTKTLSWRSEKHTKTRSS